MSDLTQTFIVKPIYPVSAGAFMVAAKNEEVLWVFYLVREEETYRFQRLLPSIDIVSEKQVVAFWREAAVLEKAQKIVVLAVDIPCNRHKKNEIRLSLPEMHKCIGAYIPHIFIGASSSKRIG